MPSGKLFLFFKQDAVSSLKPWQNRKHEKKKKKKKKKKVETLAATIVKVAANRCKLN